MTKCQITFLQSQYKLAKITPIEDSNNEPIEINMEFDFETQKVIKIIETNIKNIDIVGVLMIKSNYKYGYNRSKAPIYLFKPFDFKYPDFLVASNIKKKQKVKPIYDDVHIIVINPHQNYQIGTISQIVNQKI